MNSRSQSWSCLRGSCFLKIQPFSLFLGSCCFRGRNSWERKKCPAELRTPGGRYGVVFVLLVAGGVRNCFCRRLWKSKERPLSPTPRLYICWEFHEKKAVFEIKTLKVPVQMCLTHGLLAGNVCQGSINLRIVRWEEGCMGSEEMRKVVVWELHKESSWVRDLVWTCSSPYKNIVLLKKFSSAQSLGWTSLGTQLWNPSSRLWW